MFVKRRQKNTEKDRAKALAKARKQRRKKTIRTKYGQAPHRHSRQGMKSCIYLVLSLFFLVILFSFSFAEQGEVNILTGFAGLFILFLAYRGVAEAINGFKERDKNYITCKIGAAGCGLLLLGMCTVFIRGLF